MIEARRRPPPRTHRVRRVVIAVAFGVVVFGIGIALGETLENGPQTAVTITRVRTLMPVPLPPVRETVTVKSRHE